MVKIVLAVLFGALALGNVRPAGAQEGIASGLRLTGVLVSGQASVAIIAGADGREKVYRLGHEIHAGARLEEISAHGVMVVRDRRREWLPLVGGAAAAERKAGSAPQAQPVAELKPGAAVAASFGSSLPERRSKFSPELAKEGAITPAPGGGLQLNEVAPEGAYAAIGLRPGDVLRSVNGNPVGSGKELGALVRQVSSGQHGYVEVLRDGEVNVLRFGHAP